MANTNVFRGSDATLTLAPSDPDAIEGKEANEVIEGFQLSPVGRASDVEVYVQTDLKAYYEIGKIHPRQLKWGNVGISGKIGRAYINGALLRLLLGKGALAARVNEPFAQPSFNLVLTINDPAAPGTNSVLTVHGVKLENWGYVLPEDDFIMESVGFKGLFISVEDAQA
jgi:hypothetical protein